MRGIPRQAEAPSASLSCFTTVLGVRMYVPGMMNNFIHLVRIIQYISTWYDIQFHLSRTYNTVH